MQFARLMMVGAVIGALHAAAGAAGPAASAERAVGNSDPERIVCRKTLETGSLVRKNKQCFTLAEWDRIYAANREGNEKTRNQLSGGLNCMAGGTC